MKIDFKSKKNIIIWSLIGLLIIVAIVFLVFFNKNNDDKQPEISYSGTSFSKDSSHPTKEKINFEKVGITKSGDFVIKVTNSNDSNVLLNNISTIFKDSEGNFVEKVDSYCSPVCIPAHSFTYIYNDAYYSKNMKKYENYDFSFEIEDSFSDYFIYSGIEFNATDTKKQISVTAKNNSGNDLDSCQIIILFYKENELVGIESKYEYESVQNGESYYFNVDYPTDSNYKKIDFDKYEIYYINAQIQ